MQIASSVYTGYFIADISFWPILTLAFVLDAPLPPFVEANIFFSPFFNPSDSYQSLNNENIIIND